MSETRESDQQEQRRANFDELIELGVDPYPHAFERTHTVAASSWRPTASRPARSSRPSRSRRVTAGRILAIRSFGKANFLVLSDGRAQIQVYIRQDALPERDFQIFKLLDFGDWVGVDGPPVPHQDQRADDLGVAPRVPRQVPAAAAGEVARPERRRDPLPPALPRSDRQPGLAPGVRGAQPRRRGDPRVPDARGYPRSRDADDAADRRRRAGAAVRDASQRARHASSSCASRRSCT